MESNNLSIVPYFWFYKDEYLDKKDFINEKANELEYPLIVKASMLGSSIGVYKCDNEEELHQAIETVSHYDNKILVEKQLLI